MPADTLAPEIFDGHAAIVGRTGSGKSFTARGIVERWLDRGLRVCVVDPTDCWWGLRSDAAGTGPGFPVAIFGGAHADVPIGPRSGERIAEIITERNLPAVIVTAEMTGGERHRFMSDFLGTLYRRNKAPLHLVLDEADDVAPQNPLPENRRMLGDVDRIVRRGRVKGFRVTMITQRPAVLNKNVLSQASTLIALRLPAPQDRKAIEEWIKGQADIDQAKEVLGSLSRLDRGEGWVWAPDHGVLARTQFPLIKTFDSMRTPEHGEAVGEPSTLASVELGDLRALLAGPEPAGTATAADPAAIEAAHRAGYEQGLATANERIAEMQAGIDAAIGHLAHFIRRDGDQIPVIDIRPPPMPPTIDAAPAPPALSPRTVSAEPRRKTSHAPASVIPVTGAWQRILDAIAWLASAGIDRPSRIQVAFLSSYSPTSSGFANYLSAMRTADLVDYPDSGFVALTETGRRHANGPVTPLTTNDLHAALRDRLGPSKWSVLSAVISGWPLRVDRESVAVRSQYSPTSSGFANYLSELRTLGLIDYPSPGFVRAEDILFIGGRR